MYKRNFRTVAVLVILLATLLFTINISAREVSSYDTNGNNRIDDAEFFLALDHWLADIIIDETFFQILDIWAINGYISNNRVENASDCPEFTELIALRGGIPFRDSPNSVLSAGLASPIDIAFREGIFLLDGTSMRITITSQTPGLEPRDGQMLGALSTYTFTAVGDDKLITTAVIQNGTNFPAQHEWIRFSPYWQSGLLNGSIRVEVNLDIPGCGSMGTNLTLNLVQSNNSGQPQTDPGCPGGTQLMGLRDGVPFGRTSSSGALIAQGALTKPIDIAFRHDQFLPQGTTIEIHVVSNTSGMEPRNGTLTSPFTSTGFRSQGPLELIGTGSIQNGTNVSAQFEWASFTPYWEDDVFSGEFNVNAILNAPGCSQVEVSTTLYMTKSTISAPPTHDPGCPHQTSLIGLRNGLKMGSASIPHAGSGLTRPIDIGFKDEVFLPTGTTLRFEVSSDTTGLEPQNGEFFSPVTGSFSNLGTLRIQGNGFISNGVTISPLHEWASFTPYWDSEPTSGRFEVSVVITAPNCDLVEIETGFTMRKITSASRSAVLVSQTPQFISFLLMKKVPFQVEIRNLSGEIIFQSDFEKRIVLNRSAMSTPLANGVYLYLVRERNQQGELIAHSIQKLVILR